MKAFYCPWPDLTAVDINLIKSISYGKKGTRSHFALQIYKSLKQSTMECCNFLFDHIGKHLLDKMQNQALKVAIGAFRTTPNIALQVETANWNFMFSSTWTARYGTCN